MISDLFKNLLEKYPTIYCITGFALFTLVLAMQSILAEERWKNYAPGKLLCGFIAALFVLWIFGGIKK